MDVQVELMKQVPDDSLEDFWLVFNEGFSYLDSSGDAAERQLFYTKEELSEIARDEDYTKCVAFVENKIVGLILGTNNTDKMAKISYVNPAFISNRFPAEVKEGKFFFCNTISILPEYQAEGIGLLILRKVIEIFSEGGGL